MTVDPDGPRITTGRCVLDPLDPPTARAVLAGRLPRAVFDWPHADTRDAVSAALDFGWRSWLVRRLDTGEVIGECGIKGEPGPDGTVEIGYGLAGSARGQGYATEAVGALVAWLIDRPDVNRVLAQVALGNVASRALVRRLGFTEGRERDGYVWYSCEDSPIRRTPGDRPDR